MRNDAFPPAKLAIIPEITNLFGKNIQKQFRLYEIPRKKKLNRCLYSKKYL